jgi:hypothetical protein
MIGESHCLSREVVRHQEFKMWTVLFEERIQHYLKLFVTIVII